MSNEAIRIALQEHLALIDVEGVDTVHENQKYNEIAGRPYQRTWLLKPDPQSPFFGSTFILIPLYQISLLYPLNEGAGRAGRRAAQIEAHFRKDTQLVSGALRIRVSAPPRETTGYALNDRWIVSVTIPTRTVVT
jgi:hypothetical protein